jgi:hypothetical protein
MPAMTDQYSTLLFQGFQAIIQAAHLGIVGYVMIFVVSALLLYFQFWLKKKQIEIDQNASDAQANADQAQNQVVNQNDSKNWDDASDGIDKVISENSDQGKKPRGPTQ